jgi:hypothetical protein
LIEALNRHRGKGQQKVTVEHVHVHAGGQAVVGMVDARRGRGWKGDQRNNPLRSKLPMPAMRSPDKEREPVPVTSDAERPLPNAWRDVPRRSEG